MKYKRIDITDAKAVQYTGGISSVQKIIEEIEEISKSYFEFHCGFNDEFIINYLVPDQDKWDSVKVHKNDWVVLDEYKCLSSMTDEEFHKKFKPIGQTDKKSNDIQNASIPQTKKTRNDDMERISKNGVLPMLITSNADPDTIQEVIICNSIVGIGDANKMPLALYLTKTMKDGTEYKCRYIQENSV